MSRYILKNDHPLIPREQTYSIDRKLIAVHSEDRDINKWPNANHFELQLPQTYTNVETIELVEYTFPLYYYTFSNQNQNTKITFIADIQTAGYGITNPIQIVIEEGFYSPTQLATEIENKLNLAIQALDPSLAAYSNFKVFYDEVRQRTLFGNTEDSFTLIYSAPEAYTSEPCISACPPPSGSGSGSGPNTIIKWNQYTNWGLGYNLGFHKYQNKCNANTSAALPFALSQRVYYTGGSGGYAWLTPAGAGPVYVLVPPNPPSLNGESAMYLEIDRYNYQDEMQPYSESTNSVRNNDYNGIVNASFAKIPIIAKPIKIMSLLEYQYGNVPIDSSRGLSSFFPPLDKLSKLKFKFRYHNGTLVDFSGLNFNFTIALYCYRDEIARSKHIRTPYVNPS